MSVAAARELLDGATCWGAELDTRYRVLAVTFDPVPGTHPDGPVDDTRLQLVLHPCADVEARLVRTSGATGVVESFTAEQLVAVVERIGGTRLAVRIDANVGPLPAPRSLEGRSDAPDGRSHEVVLDLRDADRALTLRATCDVVDVRRPDGSTLPGVGTSSSAWPDGL